MDRDAPPRQPLTSEYLQNLAALRPNDDDTLNKFTPRPTPPRADTLHTLDPSTSATGLTTDSFVSRLPTHEGCTQGLHRCTCGCMPTAASPFCAFKWRQKRFLSAGCRRECRPATAVVPHWPAELAASPVARPACARAHKPLVARQNPLREQEHCCCRLTCSNPKGWGVRSCGMQQ